MMEENNCNFSGILPLFPLPNVVLFPQTLLPLHVFEPRYKKMVCDSLDGERLIGMVLLKEGWEENYYGNPEIHQIGCMGKIVSEEKLENGRCNIVLRGLERIKIENIVSDKPYRKAKTIILKDERGEGGDEEIKMIFKTLLSTKTVSPNEIKDIKEYGMRDLIDVISFLLPLPVSEKQQLLEELDAVKRAQKLLTFVKNTYISSLVSNLRRRIPIKECLN